MRDAVLLFTFDPMTLKAIAGGTRIKDLSGRGNHGQTAAELHGGKIRGAFRLTESAAGTIQGPGGAGIPVGDSSRTVCAWLKLDQKYTSGYVVTFDDFHGIHVNNKKPGLGFRGTGKYRLYSKNPLSPGKWHHIACVFSGGTPNSFTVYVDGKETASIEAPKTQSKNARTNWTLGDIQAGFSIDDVAVFDRALSGCEIQVLYHCGEAGVALKDFAP